MFFYDQGRCPFSIFLRLNAYYVVLKCCNVGYADHMLSSFLEHFPNFPNSFLVGGPADYFVIELADQVARLVK
jgi:hypothetical protein